MWRQWFKGCQPCRHDFGFLVVFASILVILVITVQHLAQLLLWNTLRMDSVNGTYMICPTINCYYLMYLHYSTLIGIVRQDHNPLLLDDPYLGKPCSSWMGEPVSPPKPRVNSAEARAFNEVCLCIHIGVCFWQHSMCSIHVCGCRVVVCWWMVTTVWKVWHVYKMGCIIYT